MLDLQEVTPINPDIKLPALPASRLKDVNSRWKTWAKIPLVMLFGVAATTLLSVFVPQLIQLWSTLTIIIAALTVLIVVGLLIITTRTRNEMRKELAVAAQRMTPLLAEKYGLDVPETLIGELITGSTLHLPVGKNIIRVGLRNINNQAVLVEIV